MQGAPATQQEMGSLRAQVEGLQAQLKAAQEAVAAAKSEVAMPAADIPLFSHSATHRWHAADSLHDPQTSCS